MVADRNTFSTPQPILNLIAAKIMIVLNSAIIRVKMNCEKIGLQPNEGFS